MHPTPDAAVAMTGLAPLARAAAKAAAGALLLVASLSASADARPTTDIMFKNTTPGEILMFVNGAQVDNGFCASTATPPDRSVSCYLVVPGHHFPGPVDPNVFDPFAATLDDKAFFHGRTFTYWIGEQGESGDSQHVSDYLRFTQRLAGDAGSGTSLFVEFWSAGEGTESDLLCKDQLGTIDFPSTRSGCDITENGTKQLLAGILVYNDLYNFSFSSGTPPTTPPPPPPPGGTVPEPATLALLATALAGAGLARRRARRG